MSIPGATTGIHRRRLQSRVTCVAPPSCLTLFIGPLENCATQVWAQLTDFNGWGRWMPWGPGTLAGDPHSVGRGSLVTLKKGLRRHDCLVTHWNPVRRLDLNIGPGGRRLGYRFELHSEDARHLELRLWLEFEVSGPRARFSTWLTALELRRGRRLLDGFQRAMQTVDPDPGADNPSPDASRRSQ